MGGNQSKTQEKRRRKKELGDEGGKQLPAIFSAQKVKGQSSVEGLPPEFKRGKKSLSFRKKLKKGWTNWAAQRGLIDPCKGEHTCSSHSQAPTKPSSVVLARKEQKKVVEVLVEEEEEEDRVDEEEAKEENKEEIKEENKEEIKEGNQDHSQKKIVTSVVVEKVDENDETEKELVSKDTDVDISPLVRRKPESPLDPDTEKCADSGEKIAAVAAETVVAFERIEAAIQFAESPEKSFENKSEENLEEKEAIVKNPDEAQNANEGMIDSVVREDVEEISHSHQAEESDEENIVAEDRCQVDTNLVLAEVSEDNEVVKVEEEKEGTVEECSLESEEVKEEKASTFDAATESEGSIVERGEDCSQEACLVHQPEIVTDTEEEPAPIGKGLSTEKLLVPDNESQVSEESVPNEIVEELIEIAIDSARPTIVTDPEPSKSAENFPLEENLGGWDEEDTWEDYDSEFDLEDCRQSRIPAYVEFEIGVWSSALWTSDMKWEKPVVVEAEEVVGWGMPFDHLTNTSSNGTWSSSSSSGDEGARKDTFDESDFCDSPVNGADDSVSTDEGIVASDDEVSEKAVSEKIKKVIVDETSPVVVNTV